MATKSFTTDLTFNRKSTDALIEALSTSKEIKKVPLNNVNKIERPDQLKKFFRIGKS